MRIAKEIRQSFSIEIITFSEELWDISPYLGERMKLKVTADRLNASLSSVRAILFQREPAPFTMKDMELRKKILELFPHRNQAPFLWYLNEEPPFEIEYV